MWSGGVLGFVQVPQHVPADAIHRRAVPVDQSCKRVFLAVANASPRTCNVRATWRILMRFAVLLSPSNVPFRSYGRPSARENSRCGPKTIRSPQARQPPVLLCEHLVFVEFHRERFL
jgi:hypothetical protein